MNDVNIVSLIPSITFLFLLLLQSIMPRRQLVLSGYKRVLHNFFLFLFNTALMRLLIPLTLLSVSAWAAQANVGLFTVINIPLWLSVLICVVILDFAIYWQHVATHKFPLLWRMHKVHHADTDMDVTTAIRFHPLELLLSLCYKSLLVVLLGAPAVAVVVFELLLFVGPAFNHSNTKLPRWLDNLFRVFIATPDTHRSHHSTVVAEQNTNYGFFIIWWDKIFGTYTQTPAAGHENMSIGLTASEDQCNRIDQMLLAPFK